MDWWTLGVLMYVLLTARQPFSSPKTHDPMEVGGPRAYAVVRARVALVCLRGRPAVLQQPCVIHAWQS